MIQRPEGTYSLGLPQSEPGTSVADALSRVLAVFLIPNYVSLLWPLFPFELLRTNYALKNPSKRRTILLKWLK